MSPEAWEAGMKLVMAIADVTERLAAFKALIRADVLMSGVKVPA